MAEEATSVQQHETATDAGFSPISGIMKEVQEIPRWQIVPGSKFMVVNKSTVVMTWILMAALLAFGMIVRRQLKRVPGRIQGIIESIVEFLDDTLSGVMGPDGRVFAPLVMSIFFFVLFSNWMGIIPFLEEPTKDINTTLGLGLGIVFVVVHGSAIKKRGLIGYIKEYFEPVWFMFPLNVVGELAKPVSHSLRLFGNIFGGGLIILVLSTLLYYILVPVFLNAFLGLFIGLIQAFVFTMLAIVYIAVQRGE